MKFFIILVSALSFNLWAEQRTYCDQDFKSCDDCRGKQAITCGANTSDRALTKSPVKEPAAKKGKRPASKATKK